VIPGAVFPSQNQKSGGLRTDPRILAPASREVVPTAEPCMSIQPRIIGFSAAPCRNPFPGSSAASESAVPRLVRAGFILSCRRSSSEFLRRSSLSSLSGRRVLPGSLPSSRRHHRCPRFARALPLPLRSVLRFSQPLDGFLHLSALRAYCIPLPRPGLSVQGLLPLRSQGRLVAGPCLPAVIVSPLTDSRRLP